MLIIDLLPMSTRQPWQMCVQHSVSNILYGMQIGWTLFTTAVQLLSLASSGSTSNLSGKLAAVFLATSSIVCHFFFYCMIPPNQTYVFKQLISIPCSYLAILFISLQFFSVCLRFLLLSCGSQRQNFIVILFTSYFNAYPIRCHIHFVISHLPSQ